MTSLSASLRQHLKELQIPEWGLCKGNSFDFLSKFKYFEDRDIKSMNCILEKYHWAFWNSHKINFSSPIFFRDIQQISTPKNTSMILQSSHQWHH